MEIVTDTSSIIAVILNGAHSRFHGNLKIVDIITQIMEDIPKINEYSITIEE